MATNISLTLILDNIYIININKYEKYLLEICSTLCWGLNKMPHKCMLYTFITTARFKHRLLHLMSDKHLSFLLYYLNNSTTNKEIEVIYIYCSRRHVLKIICLAIPN